MADAKSVLEFAKKNGAKLLDLRFTDLPGLWHHVSYPMEMVSESSFEDGFGMDGSSIRGWAAIHESDMLLIPDTNFFMMDPFTEVPTMVMVADVIDPVTKQRYDRDPRYIAKKAEMYLASTGTRRHRLLRRGSRVLHLRQRPLRPARERRLSTTSTPKRAAGIPAARRTTSAIVRATRKAISRFRPPITTRTCAPRWSMTMMQCGLEVECHHHEVATGGQTEIDLKFNSLVKSADNMMLYKYIVKNVANQYGKTVTFMPKPLFQDNGSRHAHAPIAVEGWQAALRRRRLCRTFADGTLVHRRIDQARPRALCASSLPPPTATSVWCRALKLRSTWRTRAAIARRRAVFRCTRRQPEGEARRVPPSRSELQPLHGVRCHDDGRTRRH